MPYIIGAGVVRRVARNRLRSRLVDRPGSRLGRESQGGCRGQRSTPFHRYRVQHQRDVATPAMVVGVHRPQDAVQHRDYPWQVSGHQVGPHDAGLLAATGEVVERVVQSGRRHRTSATPLCGPRSTDCVPARPAISPRRSAERDPPADRRRRGLPRSWASGPRRCIGPARPEPTHPWLEICGRACARRPRPDGQRPRSAPLARVHRRHPARRAGCALRYARHRHATAGRTPRSSPQHN